MLIEGVDYFVRLVNFPHDCGCDGVVTPNDDSTYSIYLDARSTRERNISACGHEVRHIEHNDFDDARDIEQAEKEAG